MVKKNKSMKPKYIKTLKAIGTAIVGLGLAAGTIGYFVQKNKANDLGALVNGQSVTIKNLISNAESDNSQIATLTAELAEAGVAATKFSEESLAKDAIIADYVIAQEELKAQLEQVSVSATVKSGGYDKEVSIESFNLGTLNDNQFEKLGDYNVDFDGDEVSVNEYLSIKGDFSNENKVLFNFDENDVEYKLTFDAGLNFSDDSLKVSLLGENVEITDIKDGELTVNKAVKTTVNEGDLINGAEILRIAEDSILVKVGDDVIAVNKGKSDELNDVKISVESIFYIEGAGDNLAIVRVGEDLDKVVKVGDYFDENEVYEFKSITDGEIVISLAEEQEEVSELVLPNGFATISFELSNEDYNDVKVVKDDNKLTDVYADFEEFDASKVEFKNGVWVIENDNGDDFNVTSLALKDSEFNVTFVNETLVNVAGIDVTVSDISVSGDDDEVFITEDGIVVAERDSWNEDDDDNVIISVPEESVEAKIFIE